MHITLQLQVTNYPSNTWLLKIQDTMICDCSFNVFPFVGIVMYVATIVCSYISKYMIAIWIVVLIVIINFCRCKGQMKREKCAYFCEQKSSVCDESILILIYLTLNIIRIIFHLSLIFGISWIILHINLLCR